MIEPLKEQHKSELGKVKFDDQIIKTFEKKGEMTQKEIK